MHRHWKAPVRHTRGERDDTVHACKPIVKHHLLFHFGKSQSAMEYLMTYGWAILIIAVVLGALFQLGVFNANNFAPKAPPGACRIFRPNGPGTTTFINLEGVCSGELPQYAGVFNGQSAYVQLPNGAFDKYVTNGQSFSIGVWFNPQTCQASNSWGQFFGWVPTVGDSPRYDFDFYWFTSSSSCSGERVSIEWYNGLSSSCTSSTCFPGPSYSPPATMKGTWYFALFTYNAATYTGTLYINGVAVATGTDTGWNYNPPSSLAYGIGLCNGCAGSRFPGLLVNVQFYNTSLSASEIQALYLEGIGGAPVDLQNLVGWWPLNGDANDYSGNGNNGQATAVTYTGSWTSGYTPP